MRFLLEAEKRREAWRLFKDVLGAIHELLLELFDVERIFMFTIAAVILSSLLVNALTITIDDIDGIRSVIRLWKYFLSSLLFVNVFSLWIHDEL